MHKRIIGCLLGVATICIAIISVPVLGATTVENGRIFYLDTDEEAGSNSIMSMAADGSDTKTFLAGNEDVLYSQPVVSPSGEQLAFIKFDWTVGDSLMQIINIDGTSERTVINLGEDNINSLTWSPDSSKLIYTIFSFTTETTSLRQVTINGTNDQMLPLNITDDDFLYRADWSQTGKLSYIVDGYIFNSNLDGTNALNLTVDGTWDESSAQSIDWSPDGTKLVFVAENCPGGGVCVGTMNADGSNKQIIKRDPLATGGKCNVSTIREASWSPDGQKILFSDYVACG